MRIDQITVEVRSLALGRLGQIDDGYLTDLRLIKRFRNVGSWSMSLPVELPIAQELAQPGRGIVVQGPNGLLMSGPMISVTHDQGSDDPVGTFTFQGTDDNVFLADALAFPKPSEVDVSLQTDSHDVRTGNAETVLRAYVNANIGPGAPSSRRNTAITLATNLNRGATVTGRARFDQLGVLLSDVASVGGLGFDMQQDGTNIVFTVYVPQDRTGTIRMDIDNDLLESASYGYGAPTGTRAIVAGQGQQEERRFLQVTDATATAAEAMWGRKIEVFKDRRDTPDDAELTQEGTDIVVTNGRTTTSLKVKPADDTTMVYGVDWFLGDIVQVIVDDTPLSAVVTESIVSITEDGVEVGATIGDPTGFDYEAKLIAAQKDQEERLAFLEKNAEGGGGSSGYILGSVVAWPGTTAPPSSLNLLELNGQVVLAATYADLAALHPEWVSGANMTLPDYGGRVLAGYKSGDADFGTLGGLAGSKTHAHPLSDNGIAAIDVNASFVTTRRIGGPTWAATIRAAGTTSLTTSSFSSGAALRGNTDDASDLQPSVTVKYYVCAVSSLGAFDPAVQNALSAAVAANTGNLAIWTSERPVKYTLTAAASLPLNLTGFEEYEIAWSLVPSSSSELRIRVRKAGVDQSTSIYYGNQAYGGASAAASNPNDPAATWQVSPAGVARTQQRGRAWITDLNSAAFTEIEAITGSRSGPLAAVYSGDHQDAAAMDGITLYPSAGGATLTGWVTVKKTKWL